MTRLKDLRDILQRIVIASLPLAASAGCNSFEETTDTGNPCLVVHERHFEYTDPDDAALLLRMESCRRDADACAALCQYVMDKEASGDRADTCEVSFQGDTVMLDIVHSVETFANGCSVEGRRPAGLAPCGASDSRTAAGAWLAHAAWLEAASIYAFVQLANELESFGAPRSLIQGALVAAGDEISHTRVMTALAKRYGATPPRVTIEPIAKRSLVELAVENMAEGCVRETWGAVLALWQSQTAADPVVRAAYAAIARDELRHASLAWAIHRWIEPQLDAAERTRVAATRDTFARELLDSAELAVAITALGLPDDAQTRGLLARTHDSLWKSSLQGGLS